MSLYPILPLTNGVAYGVTTQAGTPTPSAPIDLVDAIPASTYEYEEGGRRYKVTLPAMGAVGGVADIWDAATGLFTRRIGAKVFSGTEIVTLTTVGVNNVFSTSITNMLSGWYQELKCTHFKLCQVWPTTEIYKNTIMSNAAGFGQVGFVEPTILESSIQTVDDFKFWLAAQYAAGTPVVVRYQLAAPVTSTIRPEPIWVTDRDVSDYQEWLELSRIAWADMTAAQKAVWSIPMRGAYNYTDLNRVGMNMLRIQALLSGYGYPVAVDVRTDYANGDWSTLTDMDAYVQSIANVRAALPVFETTPAAPGSMDDGTVIIWNNIEQILVDVEAVIDNMVFGFRKCGTFRSGQGVILP